MHATTSRAAAWAILALCLPLLAGCGAVALESASVAVDKAKVWRNTEAAQKGDPDAQYALGNALCCSGNAPDGVVYSTAEALEWLCVAADQGNADAMIKLGRIFEGRQVDGPRLLRRVSNIPFKPPVNRAAAYYWYKRAEDAGAAKASKAAAKLHKTMTAGEQVLAAHYDLAPSPPCDWSALVAEATPLNTDDAPVVETQ